jgi:hypothetical protein
VRADTGADLFGDGRVVDDQWPSNVDVGVAVAQGTVQAGESAPRAHIRWLRRLLLCAAQLLLVFLMNRDRSSIDTGSDALAGADRECLALAAATTLARRVPAWLPIVLTGIAMPLLVLTIVVEQPILFAVGALALVAGPLAYVVARVRAGRLAADADQLRDGGP